MQAEAGACERPSEPVEDYDRVRAYEIAAYLTAASYPFDSVPSLPPEPVPSSDITLNSLVQHGVHKMDGERAFLSLIDNRSQFICAEMTKHQPLMAQSTTQPLLLGVTSIALDWGVCPYTMSVFSGKPVAIPETPYIVADPSYFFIKDFRQIPSFATRPYVEGYPAMVSYIEVPLRSMSGHVIGSYCIVDNRLRNFLDPKALDTMYEVTSAISSYLNIKRVDADRTRSEEMMDGLRKFIGSERNTYSRTRSDTEADRSFPGPFDLHIFKGPSPHGRSGVLELDGKDEHILELSGGGHDLPPSDDNRRTAPDTDTKSNSESPLTDQLADPLVSSSAATTTDVAQLASCEVEQTDAFPVTERHTASGLRMPDMPIQIDELFAKAADIIGHAMDLDGLIFFDAASSGADHKDDYLPSHSVQHQRSQSIAGESVTVAEPLCEYTGKITADASTRVRPSQTLMNRLTAAYPQGCVFAVDEYGVLNYDTDGVSEVDRSPVPHEWEELFKSVPGSRYLIFLPLWHYQRESCFATCLAWATETGKTLTHGDVNSLTAFGNSLMSEIMRLEAFTNTQSKSDFVSSISHELRSPLHGILATVELMQHSVSDPELLTLVKMIESCSTTLLDTFNHLLDFTKINSCAVDRQHSDVGTMRNAIDNDTSKESVDLEVLVEDVLGTVALGHASAKQMEHGLGREHKTTSHDRVEDFPRERVMITTHIQSDCSWILPVDKGAWKRILLNVCSNALKYTTDGYIDVELSLSTETDRDHPCISLSVADTGIGMSWDFLKYHLFTPFKQENNLSPGTGLGLSLVKSIVDSLHGQIYVESKFHEGTRVTIQVPLQREPEKVEALNCGDITTARQKLQGLSVRFLSLQSVHSGGDVTVQFATPKEWIWRSIRNICEKGFGMIVYDLASDATLPADIILIDTLDFDSTCDLKKLIFPGSTATQHGIPMLLLGNHVQGLERLFGTESSTCMTSPITRERLGAALTSALNRAMPEVPVPQQPREDLTDLDVHLRGLSLRTPPIRNDSTIDKAAIVGQPLEDQLGHEAPAVESVLPQDTDRSAPPNSSEALPISTTTAPTKHCRFKRFLLVDDNPINLKVLSAFTKRLGVPFSLASDGSEAVALYKQAILDESNPFDCCFMDLSMPVLDGFQAVTGIRQFEQEQGCDKMHIFALTGLGSEVARSTAREAGFDGYLLKPVKFRDVEPLLME